MAPPPQRGRSASRLSSSSDSSSSPSSSSSDAKPPRPKQRPKASPKAKRHLKVSPRAASPPRSTVVSAPVANSARARSSQSTTKGKGKGKDQRIRKQSTVASMISSPDIKSSPRKSQVEASYLQELDQRAEKATDLLNEMEFAFKEISVELSQAVREKLTVRASLGRVKEELQTSQASIDSTLAEQRFLDNEVAVSVSWRQDLEERYGEAKREILTSKGSLAESKAECIEVRKHMDALHAQNLDIQRQKALAFREVYDCRHRLSATKVEHVNVQSELNTAEKERKQLLAQCETIDKSIELLHLKVVDVQRDKETVKARVTEVTTTKVHVEAELGQLDTSRTKLQEKVNLITYDINQRQLRIGMVSMQYDKTCSRVRMLEDENRVLQSKVLQAERLATGILKQLSAAEERRKDLEQRMSVAMVHGVNPGKLNGCVDKDIPWDKDSPWAALPELLKRSRERNKVLTPDLLNRLHHQLETSCYNMSPLRAFRRYDKDGSGSFDSVEFHHLIRAELKIPPSKLSDKDIDTMIEFLDTDKESVSVVLTSLDRLQAKVSDALLEQGWKMSEVVIKCLTNKGVVVNEEFRSRYPEGPQASEFPLKLVVMKKAGGISIRELAEFVQKGPSFVEKKHGLNWGDAKAAKAHSPQELEEWLDILKVEGLKATIIKELFLNKSVYEPYLAYKEPEETKTPAANASEGNDEDDGNDADKGEEGQAEIINNDDDGGEDGTVQESTIQGEEEEDGEKGEKGEEEEEEEEGDSF